MMMMMMEKDYSNNELMSTLVARKIFILIYESYMEDVCLLMKHISTKNDEKETERKRRRKKKNREHCLSIKMSINKGIKNNINTGIK